MNYIKKNLLHLINFINYIIEHSFCILILVLIIFLSGVLLVHLPIVNPENIESQQILIFNVSLENWGIWCTAIGLIITAFWSTYQYTKNVARKQQEKGAEISKMVSQTLLNKCAILGKVIIQSELNNIFEFDNLKPTVFSKFNNSELCKLFKEPESATFQIKSILSNNSLQQIYFRVLETNITQKDYNSISSKTYTDEDARELFILDNSSFPFNFLELINSVLNDLEYISMYIASQSTDSKYIYQSLHQFFLKTVKLLGPIICLQNKNYSDKYYINIIYVYNYWCNLRDIDKRREHKKEEKVNKILEPKIKKV